MFKIFFIAFFSVIIISCKPVVQEKVEPVVTTYEQDEEYSGGRGGTVFDESVNAFSNPIPNLNFDENTKFVTGNSFNRNPWVVAPASTTARDGLGPMLNANSCSGCHFLDGRGRPPITPNEGLSSMIVRLSIPGFGEHNEPVPIPDYGDQLGTKGIPGVIPEGDVSVTYIEKEGKYPDGVKYSLRKPQYEFVNLGYGALPGNFLFSPRVAPKMAGTGLLDAIKESDILSFEDPSDSNADGISGAANSVWDKEKKQYRLGRLGWKSNQPGVRHQVIHAFLGDIGITSSLLSEENLDGIQKEKYGAFVTGGKPEITDDILNMVVYYTAALAITGRRDVQNEEVLKGKKLFSEIGCQKCHVAKFTTGPHTLVPQLSNQVIYPYSDLLLHDMGDDLSDGRPDFKANEKEWRTTPLWGLGLSKNNGQFYLLHDGRARSIEEAILWHGGEAERIKNYFTKLESSKRAMLLKFLDSL